MAKKRKINFDFKKYQKRTLQVLKKFKTLIPQEKKELRKLSKKHIRGRHKTILFKFFQDY